MSFEIGMQIIDVGQVAAFGHVTLLWKQFEDATRRLLDELHARRIISESDVRKLDLFGQIQLLFQGEHVVIEEAVQLLVRVIDAQLFERVAAEVFETENVQNAEEAFAFLAWTRAPVDVVQQPRKRPWVQHPSHGVSIFTCLFQSQTPIKLLSNTKEYATASRASIIFVFVLLTTILLKLSIES